MPTLLADVALALPPPGIFQYLAPESMATRLAIGDRVFVPVRNKRHVGYVVSFSDQKYVENTKEIESIVDDRPILDAHFLELTRWLAERYFCSWGQAIEAAFPAPFKKGKFLMKSRSKTDYSNVESVNPSDLPLTPSQNSAYEKVFQKIKEKKSAVFLLYGITGSGKTEVYMHLIRELIKESKGSIVLVPEISLTPQTVERFYSRFGDCLAVIHSRLSQAKRVEEWHRIRSGQAKVVIGARSAIFSPVKNLGLIVMDEEHDPSYKQEETPRYHTRQVAEKRIELEKAVLLLGSATPSIESYFESEHGRFERLTLSERIEKRPLPVVEIVDLRLQQAAKHASIFSGILEQNIRESLSKKEQVMLFLNRRGFSTYLHCSSCGYVMTCDHCRISLTYHFDTGRLVCHVCHFQMAPVRLCPGCQKNYLHYFGMGTQKVEQEASKIFPEARLGRMDSDSTSKKESHETILKAFRRGETDILIGTQMITKGHDFPNVSLIGVISADTALHVPDFRAAERTFGLLTQVAGRAGRGDIPGKVVIQTTLPHHYAIQSAKDHNYDEFYQKEIIYRKELMMPPYAHLVELVLKGRAEKEVVRQILGLGKHLESYLESGVSLMGPSPCLVSKQHGQFLWHLFVKGPDAGSLRTLLKKALSEFKKSQVTLSVDVDPQ